MVDASTTGSAQQPTIKTINVEVNLLDAWVVQRSDLEGKVLRKIVLLTCILIGGIALLPLLGSLGIEQSVKLSAIEAALNSATKERNDLEIKSKAAAPAIQRDEIVTRCHVGSEQFLSEVTKVFVSVPDQMFFEQMSADVNNSEATIKVTANAASPEVGRIFVAKAEKGTNVLTSTQTSAKQSGLTDSSIKFDYIKKVELGR